jgi:hypothetical protein
MMKKAMRMTVMRYCPNCKKEYESGEQCPACGQALLQKADAGEVEAEALLISANVGYEADLVEGSLRSAGIPYLKKGHGGPAGFFRFDTKYKSRGADFYVPAELLDRARAALPPVEGVQEIQEELAAREELKEQDSLPPTPVTPEKPGNPLMRALGILVFLLLIALVVFGVDGVMNVIRALLGRK